MGSGTSWSIALDHAGDRLIVNASIPTTWSIALRVTRVDPGANFTIEPTTSSAILAAMEGNGHVKAGADTFPWSRGDALALPAGAPYTVTAETVAYVLTASDAPVLQALGWLRPVP